MAVKFTDAKKWDDVWFSQLIMEQKVMFIYLCDVCDLAGFYEVNEKLTTLRTGIEDVRGTIESLSKSVIFKGDYIWIIKHMKHQKNLPINVKNGAHKAILKALKEQVDRFPEIYEHLPVNDGYTIKQYMDGGGGGDSPPPTGIGIGNSISNSKSKEEEKNEIKNESLIARLYKYFVGEENILTGGVATSMRTILAEAIHIMDVEEWKIYCDARLKDEFKASPDKFFLKDGWRRYQDDAKAKNKEKQQDESRRKEVQERKSLPQEEAPEEFKEFVKNLGKRTRKTETTSTTAS